MLTYETVPVLEVRGQKPKAGQKILAKRVQGSPTWGIVSE